MADHGVVWVSPELMAPPRSGADLRSTRLLQALAQHCTVTLVVVGEGEPSQLSAQTGAADVRLFDRPASRLSKALVAARHRWPTGSAAAWSSAAQRYVRARAAGGATVVVDHLQMASYLPVGGHVLSLHNAEAALLAAAPPPRSALARAARAWDVPATRRAERRALRRAGLVVAVSERDAQCLGVRALVVPNGADVPLETPAVPADGVLLFVGALKYAPNRDAVRWWAEQVWQPGLPPLTVVGGGVEHLQPGLEQHPAVHCTGFVDDVGPRLAAASAVVVPLLHGGGTRLKVLEAMAWGRPVVSTSKGVEGIPVVDGRHVLVADGAEALRDAVRRTLADTALAARLGAAARLFAEGYSWDVLTPDFVRGVLGRPRP